MILAVRTSKYEAIERQLTPLLGVRAATTCVSSKCYPGITSLSLENNAVSTETSIRNIDALPLGEAAATELQYPAAIEGMPSFKSLHSVAAVEQYEHLSQLLYINKSAGHKK